MINLPSFNELLVLAKDSSVEELERNVAKILNMPGNYESSFWTNLIIPGFYRSRKHNHVKGIQKGNKINQFICECEFWNPPIECAKIGRCNYEGESLLYCSNSWETAILESKPEIGDYISVSNFRLKNDKSLGLRINPIGVQYLSKIDSLVESKIFENYDFKKNDEFLEIDNFLDDLFHLNITKDNAYLYKLSVAVTKCMMKNIIIGETIIFMHGILYSSIVKDFDNYNLLLRPNTARNLYYIFESQTFEVIRKTDFEITIKLKRSGLTYGEKKHYLDNFDILWTDLSVKNQSEETIKLYK